MFDQDRCDEARVTAAARYLPTIIGRPVANLTVTAAALGGAP